MNQFVPEGRPEPERLEVEATRNKETGEYRVIINVPIETAHQMDMALERQTNEELHPLQVALRALLRGVGYVS